MARRIYLASSWRNPGQPMLVRMLRNEGHDVYDFREPKPGVAGFAWSDIDPAWESWSSKEYIDALRHPIAIRGFASDEEGMRWADTCVLLLPCGRSAHIEAGWFAGAGRDLFILTNDEQEPELMYKFATGVAGDVPRLFELLR